jgi:hypothetical protein
MKKKIISSLVILTCLCNQSAFASTGNVQEQQNETEIFEGTQTVRPLQEIVIGESSENRPRNDSNLQNWLFAAGSIVSATVAMLIVGWSQGEAPRSH